MKIFDFTQKIAIWIFAQNDKPSHFFIFQFSIWCSNPSSKNIHKLMKICIATGKYVISGQNWTQNDIKNSHFNSCTNLISRFFSPLIVIKKKVFFKKRVLLLKITQKNALFIDFQKACFALIWAPVGTISQNGL